MRARWAKVALMAAGAGVLALLIAKADFRLVGHYLDRIGPGAALILVPYVFVQAFDAIAWRATFTQASQLRIATLWRIRVASDAVMNSLPGGAALSEALRTLLLQRCCGVPITAGAANVLLSKIALALAQGLFVLSGVSLAAPWLEAHSVALLGRDGLASFAIAAALAFFLVLLGLAWLAQHRFISRALSHLRPRLRERWQLRLARYHVALSAFDDSLAASAADTGRLARTVGFFFLGWLCLGLEGWVILSALGEQVSVGNALSIEAMGSLVRLAFFFIPAGLGAQELGYYALLKTYGIANPESVAAAFMVLKRGKETLWIGTGYVLLALLPARLNEARQSLAPQS